MKARQTITAIVLATLILVPSVARAEGGESLRLNDPSRPVQFKAAVEFGFISVLDHHLKFGTGGTYIDYVEEGGQDNLYFFARVSAEMQIVGHHSLVFLYQPLNLETTSTLERDAQVADVLFPEDTAVDFRYGFDFYRFSYLYDFFKDPDQELAIGLSLQIRNASISFTSVDGDLRIVRNNIGPVPAFKIRGRYTFKPGVWIGGEVDGFWIKGKWVSGSSKNFEGAILDASVRAGYVIAPFVETFVNLRYLGGGALGGKNLDFTRNWLHTLTFSIGIGIR
jgi:hypothetical protein